MDEDILIGLKLKAILYGNPVHHINPVANTDPWSYRHYPERWGYNKVCLVIFILEVQLLSVGNLQLFSMVIITVDHTLLEDVYFCCVQGGEAAEPGQVYNFPAGFLNYLKGIGKVIVIPCLHFA